MGKIVLIIEHQGQIKRVPSKGKKIDNILASLKNYSNYTIRSYEKDKKTYKEDDENENTFDSDLIEDDDFQSLNGEFNMGNHNNNNNYRDNRPYNNNNNFRDNRQYNNNNNNNNRNNNNKYRDNRRDNYNNNNYHNRNNNNNNFRDNRQYNNNNNNNNFNRGNQNNNRPDDFVNKADTDNDN